MKLKYLKVDIANFGYNAFHIEAPNLSISLNSFFYEKPFEHNLYTVYSTRTHQILEMQQVK